MAKGTPRQDVLLRCTVECTPFRSPVTVSFEGDTKPAAAKARQGSDVLPSVEISGDVGTGKTSLIRALSEARNFIRDKPPGDGMHGYAQPNIPWYFESEFISQGKRYEYGYSLDDDLAVAYEWAYWYPHGRRSLVYERSGSDTSHRFNGTERWLVENNGPKTLTAGGLRHVRVEHTALYGLTNWFKHNLLSPRADAPESQRHTVALISQSVDNELFRGSPNEIDRLLSQPTKEICRQMLRLVDKDIVDGNLLQRRWAPEDVEERNYGRDTPWGEYLSASSLSQVQFRFPDGTECPVSQDSWSNSLRMAMSVIGPVAHILSHGGTILLDDLDKRLPVRNVFDLLQRFNGMSASGPLGQVLYSSMPSDDADGPSTRRYDIVRNRDGSSLLIENRLKRAVAETLKLQ